MRRILIVLMLTILAAAALGCGGDSESTPEETPATAPATIQATPLATPTSPPSSDSGSNGRVEQPSSGDESDGDSGHSSSSEDDDDATDHHDNGDSNGDSDHHDNGDSEDDVVSRKNPGFTGVGLDFSRNDALKNAESSRLLVWTWEAHIKDGALQANGRLTDGAQLFDPTVDGDGAGFVLYYKDSDEPLVLLLPDLGPTHIWDTFHTVAEMEHEFEEDNFSIRAYSPLFMDVGPNDLVIRVFGVDRDGNDAVLAVAPVAVP